MELVKKEASHGKALTTSWHLEYMWGWKKFVAPYIFVGSNALVRMSTKFHFKLCLIDNKLFGQTKSCACDYAWEPIDGYQCLNEMLQCSLKSGFIKVWGTNDQEIKAPEEFRNGALWCLRM